MHFMIALIVIISLVGCGDSSKLSRDKAKNLIQNYVEFNTIIGKIQREGSGFFFWNKSSHLNDNEIHQILSPLAREGFITYSIKPRRLVPSQFQVALTEKGRQYMTKEDASNFEVKFCERQIFEVSGIEQPEPQFAKVYFTYKTANPTPFGATASKVCSGIIGEGEAYLKFFDDGWRVSGLRLP